MQNQGWSSASYQRCRSAPALVDLVVFACGICDMKPFTMSETGKAMLPIATRPIIWYCLKPWMEAGFRSFYLCVDDDYAALDTYLRHTFGSSYKFHFVVVASRIGGGGGDGDDEAAKLPITTTSDAIKAFLEFKDRQRDQHTESVKLEADRGRRLGGTSQTSSGGLKTSGSASPLPAHDVAMELYPRDAILLHSDTILANVDIEGFIKNFYASLSSVTMMLMKPIESSTSQYAKEMKEEKGGAAGTKPGARQGGGGGAGKKGSVLKARPFEYSYSCVVYEDEEDSHRELNSRLHNSTCQNVSSVYNDSVEAEMRATPLSGYAGSPNRRINTAFTAPDPMEASMSATNVVMPLVESYPPHFHRLHVIANTEEMELRITMPYAARRPRLKFERGVVDPNVYLVRHWVLQYIAEKYATEEDSNMSDSIEESAIPNLALEQHAIVNKRKNVFLSPSQRIDFCIPPHWLFREPHIDALNGSSAGLLPHRDDPLVVSAMIFEEHPQSFRRIYRIHNVNNLIAANEEVVACRAAGAETRGKLEETQSVDTRQLAPFASPQWPPRQQALSLLLPDCALTVQTKKGSQGLYVKDSFCQSHVPPNAYITRSIIGPDVKVHPGARITDCLIMQSVEVRAGAEVVRSVLGSGSVVEPHVKVGNAVVEPMDVVVQNTEG